MKMSGRAWVKLACVMVVATWSAAPAAVIIDDNFDGPAGTAPNGAIWQVEGNVSLDGVGNVVLGSGSPFPILKGAMSYAVQPATGTPVARITIQGQAAGTCNVFGIANSNLATGIVIRNDGIFGTDGNYWSFLIANNGSCQTYQSSVPATGGNWVLDWYADRAMVYLNGGLVFDTQVNAPTIGSGPWIIPNEPMRPYLGDNPLTNFSVGRITWETVPEPATLVLLTISGWWVRRKR